MGLKWVWIKQMIRWGGEINANDRNMPTHIAKQVAKQRQIDWVDWERLNWKKAVFLTAKDNFLRFA